MKIGLQISNFTWPGGPAELGARLAEIGRTADDAGFASIWVMDHFFQIAVVGEIDEPMLEGYSALSFLAGVTRRPQLGTLVTGVLYRYPGILVKTVSTLDVLSGGRAWLGIGAGWFEREARGLGVPFPPLKDRFEQLEEALQIALQMWSGQATPFQGKHYQLAETLNRPLPVSRPHPPIMIGGMGEQKTLRLVAQYANACNLFWRAGPEQLGAKIEVLRQHCATLGRPFEEIEITALDAIQLGQGGLSAQDVIEQCRAARALGIQHMIFGIRGVHELAPLEVFGREIIPAVAEL